MIRIERAARRNPERSLAYLPEDALTSSFCVAELFLGWNRARTAEQREAAWGFISLVQSTLGRQDFGYEEALVWAQLFEQLRASGQTIGERDLLIAASAVANGHAVMTDNVEEFSRVPGLEVRTFPSFA